jgi:hypothetical protein
MNAIIGFYSGYTSLDTDKGGLRIFVNSFRKYNKSDLIIITLVLPIVCDELIEFSKTNNCIIEPVILNDIKTGNRWKCYKDVLTKPIYSNLKKILIMDMNDAMFASNPFDINIDNKLYCAAEKTIYDIEEINNNINSLNINTTWMNQCYKLENNKKIPILHEIINNNNLSKKSNKNMIEQKIFKKPIICSGSILGTYEIILKLLDWGYNFLGADQGLLNIYVYMFNLDNSILIPLNYSDILTMDSVNFNKLKKDNNGYIYNDNNIKYSIYHQIDRGGGINKFLLL